MTYIEDREDAPCGHCGQRVHLQHWPPCPHGYIACPGCDFELVCDECARVAELERLDELGEVPC